jgi:hypothetical protein
VSENAAPLLLSRRTRRHAVLFGLQKVPLIVMGVYIVVAVAVAATFQSWGVIALVTIGGVALYIAMRQPLRMDREPWLFRLVAMARTSASAHDAFTPTDDTPFPRPVGDILIMGLARSSCAPEQAVIRHSTTGTKGAYFTATVEIEGRGDGLRSAAAIIRDDNELERVLNRLAETRYPVEEISLMTRATPGLPPAFKTEVRGMCAPGLGDTMLGGNIEQRMLNLDRVSDHYRMFATLRIPEAAIYRWADERRGATDRETICQAIHHQVGEVAELLNGAGLQVVHGLGPRRLGALIRHLYVPSRDIDDLSGLRSARDGFPSYPRPLHEALQVPDWGRDVLWYHATGMIAPYGWPADRVSHRWLLPAVAQVFDAQSPSVIRTVTASWRLLNRRESQRQMADQLLSTLTQVARDQGKVTTGEDQEQADAGHQVLYDLRHQSSGVIPSVRLTCTAPSHTGLLQARGLVESAMSDLNVDAFTWCDGRQADAMVLSLPLARGLLR